MACQRSNMSKWRKSIRSYFAPVPVRTDIICTYSRLICIQFYIIINGGKSYKDISSDLCRSKSIAAMVRADNEFNITSTEHTYIAYCTYSITRISSALCSLALHIATRIKFRRPCFFNVCSCLRPLSHSEWQHTTIGGYLVMHAPDTFRKRMPAHTPEIIFDWVWRPLL